MLDELLECHANDVQLFTQQRKLTEGRPDLTHFNFSEWQQKRRYIDGQKDRHRFFTTDQNSFSYCPLLSTQASKEIDRDGPQIERSSSRRSLYSACSMEFGPFARDLRGSQLLLRPHSATPGGFAANGKKQRRTLQTERGVYIITAT